MRDIERQALLGNSFTHATWRRMRFAALSDGRSGEGPAARDGTLMQTSGQATTGIRMKRVWLLFLLASATAGAENLYRCVENTGAVSYQSHRCTRGVRLDRTIQYTPSPERSPPRDGDDGLRAKLREDAAGRRVQYPRRFAATFKLRGAPERCRAAKLKRQSALDRLGLQRTYAQLSKLDEPVRGACGGF